MSEIFGMMSGGFGQNKMEEPIEFKVELIGHTGYERVKVIGGWMLSRIGTNSASIFVSDPYHYWQIANNVNDK